MSRTVSTILALSLRPPPLGLYHVFTTSTSFLPFISHYLQFLIQSCIVLVIHYCYTGCHSTTIASNVFVGFRIDLVLAAIMPREQFSFRLAEMLEPQLRSFTGHCVLAGEFPLYNACTVNQIEVLHAQHEKLGFNQFCFHSCTFSFIAHSFLLVRCRNCLVVIRIIFSKQAAEYFAEYLCFVSSFTIVIQGFKS